MIEITESAIDYAKVTESVRSSLAGAVVLFLGTTREMTGDRRTLTLDYEAYPEMARKTLEQIRRDALGRWPLQGVAITHRVGPCGPGEVSVAVAVSSPHRGDAFAACEWLMDTLKKTVPIWKKEVWADGSEEWVHPAPEDIPPPPG